MLAPPVEPATGLPAPLAASRQAIVPAQPVATNEVERQLVLLAYDIDEELRVTAAEDLAAWVPGEAEAGLAQAAAADESPRVREAALRSLEGALATDVVALFAEALTDPDLWVQDAGETGLYRNDDRDRSKNALALLCLSEARDVRLRAAELLDEMDAGELPWDELYDGPTGLPWAPPPSDETDPSGDTDDH
ncbi:MAG: hypothetical protein DRQ55_12050 [Planctomycetota bacterium]|nr:MAG: hypothetical protein DRQ55_12050 [Planctomycetota bacterium]